MITTPRKPLVPHSDSPLDEPRRLLARARAFGVLLVLLFLGLVARLWLLQIVHGADYRQAAEDNQARRVRTRAPRGVILDSRGAVLAANRSRFAIYATPEVLKDLPVLGRLAGLLHDTPEDIRETILSEQQNPYDSLRVAIDVPLSVVTQIEENKPFLPGISTEPEPVRWYPHGPLAAHLLGSMGRIDPKEYEGLKKTFRGRDYFSDDFLGKTGVERKYESSLHGRPGGTDMQIDAKGRRIRTVGSQDAVPGGTVTLALDTRVQAAAEKVFRDRRFTGAAVAIDPRTGGVLAMVSAPSYDPDAFATGIKAQDWKPLHDSPDHPLLNRAVDAMYPPGSTFKPVVSAAGLQTGAMTTRSTAFSPGYYYLGRARFGDWKACGFVNFYTAMAQSCDVFYYIYGQRIGPEGIARYAKAFGMAEKTGIDLTREDIGSVPSPSWKQKRYGKLGPAWSKWYGGDTLHMSIGQGYVLATPLQMARVAAAVANGGDVLQPYVVRKVTDPVTGRVLRENTRTVVRHVPVSPQNMEEVRRAMRVTVTSGTAKVVLFPQVAVAGKTGSAQVHGKAMTHGWFICFAPYDHPTIAIAAVVEYGGHGANTAGKVARAMLQTYFHLPVSAEQTAKSD